MDKFLLTLLFLTHLLGLQLQAQPTVVIPDITVDESQAFDLDVTVTGFEQFISMQYSIHWDQTKLQYVDVYNFNLPSLQNSSFGDDPINTDNGILTMAWLNSSLQGVSVADGTRIFTIRMKAIGNPNDTIPVIFSNSPTVLEVIDTSQSNVAVDLISGQVVLADLVDAENFKKETLKLYHNYPNPVKDYTFLQFELKETTLTTLTITDLSGKEIYRKEEKFSAGLHQHRIDASVFPASGEYVYKVKTTDNQLIGKLIFVK